MPNSQFIPSRSTHAIVGTAFACELAAPVSTEIVTDFVRRYDADEDLKSQLPAKSEERGFRIELGLHVGQVGQDGGLLGARFERYSPDGIIEWSLSLRGALLLVSCNAYSRWSDVFPQATQLLQWALDAMSAFGVGITAVGLEYQDEFNWQGDIEQMNPTELFRSDTDVLPAQMLARRGLWHNYAGWFEDSPAQVKCRRLVNVNVAFVQRENRGVAQVTCSHKGLVSDLAAEAAEIPIASLLDELHTEHKQLVGRLLADPIKQRINLDQ